nr:hypothetical protein Itr_chr01CG13760 [Ipomoea trifida]
MEEASISGGGAAPINAGDHNSFTDLRYSDQRWRPQQLNRDNRRWCSAVRMDSCPARHQWLIAAADENRRPLFFFLPPCAIVNGDAETTVTCATNS